MFEIKVFNESQELYEQVAEQLMALSFRQTPSHIALSGGSTPKAFYRFIVGSELRESIQWENLHFWWGDERMVSLDSEDSNAGEAIRTLFDHIKIPDENIHRICGEKNREDELARLEVELIDNVKAYQGRPCFDWILLGVGKDGHTASLFPGQVDYEAEANWVAAEQPETEQERISLSAETICNARWVTFMVTGVAKAQIVNEVFAEDERAEGFPASNIFAFEGQTDWLLDADAARLLVQD